MVFVFFCVFVRKWLDKSEIYWSVFLDIDE